MNDSDRDLFAVQEDALLLDILAARGDLSAFSDDPLAPLLGSYVGEVDDGLELVDFSGPVLIPPATAVGHRSKKHSARFLVAAGTAVVMIGTSGVAAAVTGDPLSPIRAAVNAATGGAERAPTANDGTHKDLPDQAAEAAEVARSLGQARRSIARGHLVRAQRQLDELKNGLAPGTVLPPGLVQSMADLQSQVDHPSDQGNSGQPANGDKNEPGQNQGNNNQSDKNQPGQNQQDKNQSGKNQPGQNQQDKNQSGKNQNDQVTSDDGQTPPDQPSTGQGHKPTSDSTGPGAGNGGSTKGRPSKPDSGASGSDKGHPDKGQPGKP